MLFSERVMAYSAERLTPEQIVALLDSPSNHTIQELRDPSAKSKIRELLKRRRALSRQVLPVFLAKKFATASGLLRFELAVRAFRFGAGLGCRDFFSM